jgi:Bacterial Ig-like domain/FG-GAP-like repeat
MTQTLKLPLHRLLAASALVVAACGGGGGGGGSDGGEARPTVATAADNYFPLEAAARWAYSPGTGAATVVTRVTGAQLVAGASGTAVRSDDLSDGSVQARVYVAGADGVRVYAAAGASAIERALDGVQVLRWPLSQGDSFGQVDRSIDDGDDYDGDGRSDRYTVRGETSAIGRESLATPVATFSQSLHLRQSLRVTVNPSGGAAAVNIELTIDSWYAGGVGPVKTVVQSRGAGADSTRTEVLAAYRMGGVSSDSLSPVVQATAPMAGVPSGPGVPASVSFNKPMDPLSVSTADFTVVDGAGRPVAGAVQVRGATVRFVPATPWLGGDYTARLGTAARDLMGNAVAEARSWSFSVDASGPTVYWTRPYADQESIALDSPLVVTFGEIVDPSTVNTDTFRLSEGGTPVPVSLNTGGAQVVVTPLAPLQRDRQYQLDVAGVKDAYGNAMAQALQLRFRSNEGRLDFAPPERLYPELKVLSTAAGDVNGDGRVDVIFTVNTSNFEAGYQYSVYVRAGRADGGFDEPARLDIGALDRCYLDGLVVGDVNGDGRADLIVGSSICTVLVLHQTSAGTLEAAATLDRPAGVLRVADLDGDGRLDLVGVTDESPAIHLWRQNAAGQLVLSNTLGTEAWYSRDVEIGDLNNDGRPDLVVALEGIDGRHIALFMQQSGGGFAAPVFLDTRSVWGARALALGDLNGDGRLDIVATGGGNSPTTFALFYQGSGGGYGEPTPVQTYDGPFVARVADVNGDGRDDLVVLHVGHYAVGVYLQRPGGGLRTEERFLSAYGTLSVHQLLVIDVDRDGLQDILIAYDLLRQRPPPPGPAANAQALRSRVLDALRGRRAVTAAGASR